MKNDDAFILLSHLVKGGRKKKRARERNQFHVAVPVWLREEFMLSVEWRTNFTWVMLPYSRKSPSP